jgi:hypothetical protein
MAPVTTSATIYSFRPKLLKPEAGSETRLLQTSVAMVLGLNAALFLQQLNFRLRTPSHVVDGVAWYEVSYDTLQAVDFPFWSTKTIARTCRRLEKRGIITARPLSRNTYDRTKWYTINDERLQEVLGSTSGQSVPIEGTPSPHHDQDTLSPSLKEEKREKKEPEGQVAIEVEEEDRLPAESQAAAADTPPAGAAPQAETHTTEIPVASHAPEKPGAATHQRAELPAPAQQDPGKPGHSKNPVATEKTEKQQACPHPFAEVVTLTGGITICNHCFGLVAFDPLAEAA